MHELLISLFPYAGSHHQGLTNHVPMELLALQTLGANAEMLLKRRDAGIRLLEPLQDDGRVLAHWLEGAGDSVAEAALRRYFTANMEQAIWHSASLFALEQMLGGSFHGVIRMAYAMRSHCDAERVAALAYAVCCARKTPELSGPAAPCDSMSALHARMADICPLLPPNKLIADDIAWVLQLPQFVARLPHSWPQETPRTSRERVRALFAVKRDFDVLHLITGWEAALSVAQALGLNDVPAKTAPLMQAANLALWLCQNGPALPDVPKWQSGQAKPLAELDAHSVKLILSARRLARMDHDEGWLALADDVAAHGWRGYQP